MPSLIGEKISRQFIFRIQGSKLLKRYDPRMMMILKQHYDSDIIWGAIEEDEKALRISKRPRKPKQSYPDPTSEVGAEAQGSRDS